MSKFKAVLVIFLLPFSFIMSEDNNADEESAKKDTLIKTYDFPQIDIIGRKPSLLNRIPGSASLITNRTLYITRHLLHRQHLFR